MSFDGEVFVQDMREELMASGRSLDRSDWVERVVQGEATKEDLVGWARQHYWGVTYHTRRVLSGWVTRMPYEMTDAVIENVAEEVLGTQSKSGHSHLHWLFEFTRALGAPDEVITEATPNVDAIACSSFLYNLAFHRPWYEVQFGGVLGIENQIPPAYTRVVEGFKTHYADVLAPDDYAFHTIHIYVDEDHGGGVGAFAERYLDTEEKRRDARVAYLAGAELTRRCWDALDGAAWQAHPVERRSAPDPAGRSSAGYTTVRKAMAVISAFSYAEPVLGVSELSRRLGLGKSTVHRLLTTLAADGFVERTPDERYRLSLKLYEIGQQVVASLELREVAHTPLERLRNASGETSHLAVLAVPDVVYLDRFESPSTLRMFTRFGRRTPAHCTSSGKCLLAFGRASDVERVIEAGLPRLGPRTITGRTMFRRAMTEVRRRGYALSIEESESGVVSAGAPVFDHSGDCIAAVSVAGPIIRMPPNDLDRFVRLVVATAAEVSAAMGARASLAGSR